MRAIKRRRMASGNPSHGAESSREREIKIHGSDIPFQATIPAVLDPPRRWGVSGGAPDDRFSPGFSAPVVRDLYS